ncbi:Hypothetical protein ING2D1G_0329 [Peptoniphilus sp. ING2-D1G]|nr:Hypothetical protein ING2D1G_0329 [Peptoniphilus sp. ING2-D1G]
MSTKGKNKIYLILILISILFSIYFLIGRYKAEMVYRNYEIVADYNEFSKLGYIREQTPVEYFTELKNNGVTTASFNELTIATMKSSPNYKIQTEIIGNDLLVKGDKKYLDIITKGLETLKDKRNIEVLGENEILIEGKPKDLVTYDIQAYDISKNLLGKADMKGSILEYVGLGYDEEAVDEIKSIEGMSVILRPIYLSSAQDSRLSMERFIKNLKDLNPNQSYIIFSGKEFYKNTKDDMKIQDDFTEFITEKNIALGLVEAANQRGHLDVDGINSVIKKDEVKKLRAFTTWDYLASQYDYKIPFHDAGQELANVYYRALSERNISTIFLSPFVKDQKIISDPELYGNVLSSLQSRMQDKGYTLGDAKPMGSWNVNSIYKIPVALGSVAASVLLLNIVFNVANILSLLILSAGAALALLFFGLGKMEELGNVLFNLNSIIVFPLISICYILKNYKSILIAKKDATFAKIFFKGAAILLMAILITMVGALHEIAFMSGTNYLVELNIFRGVKISQLLPLLFALIIYAAYIGFNRDPDESIRIKPGEIKDILITDVKIWHAVLGVLMFLVLVLFIIRGGNTNIEVPKLELFIRNLMEQYLPARPRTKSIIAGYPAIMLMIYIAYKNRAQVVGVVLTLLATIGMTNIVNTFSHIRTPLRISFMRVGVEYIVSLIISLIVLIIADLIRKGYESYIE